MIHQFRVIPSVYQVILMILSVKGAATMWRETEGFTGAKLLKVLLADQVLYFLVYVYRFLFVGTADTDWEGLSVMLCLIANIVGFATNFGSFFSFVLYVCGSPSLLCVLGNHLLIHLKEAGEAGRNEGTSYAPKNSSINFADGHLVSGTCYTMRLNVPSNCSLLQLKAGSTESDVTASSA